MLVSAFVLCSAVNNVVPWPLLLSPSPGALPRSGSSAQNEQRSSGDISSAESLLTCIEKFLLAEHNNSASIILSVACDYARCCWLSLGTADCSFALALLFAVSSDTVAPSLCSSPPH